MKQYVLAIDIGASSGRHILGHMENGKMIIEEVYRFANGMMECEGELVWDIETLFYEIKAGMKKCREMNKIPVSMGIDTWAVDFVLLDQKMEPLGNAVAYRDTRTKGMQEQVFFNIKEEELYERTGIQKQPFNTIYQLMAIKEQKAEYLEKAEKMLLIPDYFHFLLTGKTLTEYTNATTTQLVNVETNNWDWNLIELLGFPKHIFPTMNMPGTKIGCLSEEIQKEVGFHCEVIFPATHDTASAVVSVPGNGKDTLYISSGTWSLMGTELLKPNCSKQSRLQNITNEGGYNYRFRFLKNIMGLWMIQSVKKEIGENLSFHEICKNASKCEITSIVDCNDRRFLSPTNMKQEVKNACKEKMQQVPQNLSEVAAVIYNSLAKCYAKTVLEIEEITGITYQQIQIVGGGCNAEYLNELTAKETKKEVYAGIPEATAVGNIAVQMISLNVFQDLDDARSCIANSFEITKYLKEEK